MWRFHQSGDGAPARPSSAGVGPEHCRRVPPAAECKETKVGFHGLRQNLAKERGAAANGPRIQEGHGLNRVLKELRFRRCAPVARATDQASAAI